jgi:hypothetical protein
MIPGDQGEGQARRPRIKVKLKGFVSGGACMTVAAIGPPDAVDSAGQFDSSKLAGVELLVDTGATESCIRRDVARVLALPVTGSKHIRGFEASTLCQVVSGILVLPDKGRSEFKHVPLIVADIEVPMIFGMSEIAQGVLVVDGLKGRWRWSLPQS